METNEIIMFFINLFAVLFMQISSLILGNANDCYFSDKTIKKLTVPKNSFLRKLVIFKEGKMTNPPFLYIRVIPYLIHLFIVIVSTILFFINQFVVSFIPGIVFIIIGWASFVAYLIYGLALFFLSRGLRL